ncbi:MAG: peptidylprolyl isomerase [Bradymonadia bacterium]
MKSRSSHLTGLVLVACIFSLGYAQPKRVDKPEASRLKLTTPEGEINCTLDMSKEITTKVIDEIKSKHFDGSFICRAVMDYFVHMGCRKSTMSNIEKKPLGFDLPRTGSHKKAGVLSVVKGPGDFGRLQLVIMLRPTTWLDGTQTVIGQCRDLEFVRHLARKPTVAGGKPRQPTQIITAEILGPDLSKRRNGLAK